MLITERTDTAGKNEASVLVDKVAPLGLKKKLLSFNTGADPALDARGLPPYRGVQKYQIGKLLDSVGEHLAAIKHPVGVIADEERTTVLNDIVGFCYGRLRDLVASLAGEGVLEFVIKQHEAILHRQALGKATIATRLACFGDDATLVDSFREDLKDEARDAISIRFLIEYLAASSPTQFLRPVVWCRWSWRPRNRRSSRNRVVGWTWCCLAGAGSRCILILI